MKFQFHTTRLQRAREHELYVTGLDFTQEGSFLFSIQGLTDDYVVEIQESIEHWPPTCTCEDYNWRSCSCKHILLILDKLHVSEDCLSDCSWEPTQQQLYEILSEAPGIIDCVHFTGARINSEEKRVLSIDSIGLHNVKNNYGHSSLR